MTDIGTLRLHAHFDEGTGPAIVMLHGINSDGGDWRPVIDRIGTGYRFIAFDLLGFGKSPKPLDIEYSADNHARVIEQTLLDMGVDDPFLLVGYSLGGDIAVRYASTYPQRVRRLFLLAAPYYLPASALSSRNVGAKVAQEVLSRSLWKWLAGSKERNSLVYRLVTGLIEDPIKDVFHAEDMPSHWEIMSSNLTHTVNTATFVDDLPKLTMPVVFCVGVRDAIVSVSQTPELARLKPDMEIRVIRDLAADHMVLWNMPERVADEIMADEIRTLNVAWRGGSGEPMMLLHSAESSADDWMPTARALANGNDVAVIDLLGFGGSPAPLSAHYTLADHVAPVLGTANALWGPNARVRFVGESIGATIALGCAATAPERSAGVVAFSPAFLEPGTSLDDVAVSDRAARVVAQRDRLERLVADVRARKGSAAKVEQRVVPIVRSLENVALAPDADVLLGGVPAPATLVVPHEDTLSPRGFLTQAAARRTGFEVLEPPGDHDLPYRDPAAAVEAIDPGNAKALDAAKATGIISRGSGRSAVEKYAAGIEDALLRTGILNLIAAAVIVVLHPIPQQVLVTGFAGWVLFASLSTIIGAIGMRGSTQGVRFSWATAGLPLVLMGLAGVGAVAFIFLEPEVARRVFGTIVALYAAGRGAAELYVALRVKDVTKPRWLLYLGAAAGIVTALAILFGPQNGRVLVRIALAGYFILTGLSLIAYVVSVRLAARRRVQELLARHQKPA